MGLNPNFGMTPRENASLPDKLTECYTKDATQVYAQNKRQQVVFMEELCKKYKSSVEFSTMHPGWAETEAVKNSMPDFHKKMEGKWRSPDQGADTIVWLCLKENGGGNGGNCGENGGENGGENDENGKFWLDRKMVGTKLLVDCRGGDGQANRDVLMKNLEHLYAQF